MLSGLWWMAFARGLMKIGILRIPSMTLNPMWKGIRGVEAIFQACLQLGEMMILYNSISRNIKECLRKKAIVRMLLGAEFCLRLEWMFGPRLRLAAHQMDLRSGAY